MGLAIAFELLGTNCAKLSAGLRLVRPTVFMYITYGISVSFLAAALNNGGINNNSLSAAAAVEGGNGGDGATKFDPAPIASTNGLDLGAAYAAWSGIGTIVAALLGVFLYGETLVPTQVIGIVLTIVGVSMVNLVPSTAGTLAGVPDSATGTDGVTDFITVSTAMNIAAGSSNTYGSFDTTNSTNI